MTTLFCKDCRHCRLTMDGGYEFSNCQRTGKESNMFLVTGQSDKTFRYCSVERGSACPDSCGPTAKFFEPKEQT